MKQPNHANPEDINLNNAVPDMPESFRMRIRIACETLPEQERRLPVRGIALAAALCLVAVLAVFFSIGQLGGAPDMLTPLTNSASGGDTDLPGDDEEANYDDDNGYYSFNSDGEFYHCIPYCQGQRNRFCGPLNVASENGRTACPVCLDAEYIDPAFLHEEYTVEEMQERYASHWPFEDNSQLFDGTVYLYEYTFDPYYHVDPEKCGAGTKDDMLKTIRQMAYRRYEREICLTCAPVRDLKLMVWLNEGGRYYHMEKECCGEVMQVRTTLEKAVNAYEVPYLCPYCTGLLREDDIDSVNPEYIVEINRNTYEITLNSEWAYREVHLAKNGVYHYDALCAEGELEPMSQLVAVRDHKAAPCAECMGEYTRKLAVYYNEGDAHYHAISICGGSQMNEMAFQYQAMENGLTICPDCFKNY